MNIYLLEQNVVNGYDTYDGAVVVASCVVAAKLMHPDQEHYADWDGKEMDTWCAAKDVKVTQIGTAIVGIDSCAVLASFYGV